MPGQATWDLVRDVLNDAAVELGLIESPNASPLESLNANLVQLSACLKTAGRRLTRKYQWPQLRRPYQFNTQNGRAAYDMPPSVLRIIDNTTWAPGINQPLVGPLEAADWQALLRRGPLSAMAPFFRYDAPTLTFLPTPASTRTITLEYWSRYWLKGVDDSDLSIDAPATSDDTIYLDAPLICAATKLKWLQLKGFPTDAMQDEYDQALDNALATASTASALVVGNPRRGPLLIGAANLPDTGWGLP